MTDQNRTFVRWTWVQKSINENVNKDDLYRKKERKNRFVVSKYVFFEYITKFLLKMRWFNCHNGLKYVEQIWVGFTPKSDL